MKFFFSLLAVWSIAFVFSTATAQTTNILFLAGERSHKSGEHEFNAGCQLLAKALNEQRALDIHATVMNGGLKMSPSSMASMPLLSTPTVPKL